MTDRSDSPKCPKCGFVMCEQFDEQRTLGNSVYVVPNGTFICYHCHVAIVPEVGK